MDRAVPVGSRIEPALLELEEICRQEVMNRDAIRANVEMARAFFSTSREKLRSWLPGSAEPLLRTLRAALRHGFEAHVLCLVKHLAALKSPEASRNLLSVLLEEGVSGPLLDLAMERCGPRIGETGRWTDLAVSNLLSRAAESGNIEGARTLMATGCVPQANGSYIPPALFIAALSGRDEFLLALLEEFPGLSGSSGRMPASDRKEASIRQEILLSAIWRCAPETVAAMIDRFGFSSREMGHRRFTDPRFPGGKYLSDPFSSFPQTPLSAAIASSRPEMAAVLLERGGVLRALNEAGETPLHLAAAVGNLDGVRLGIGLGLDLQARSLDGLTPFLSWAERLPDETSQEELAEKIEEWKILGARLDDTDNALEGALLLAVRNRRFRLAQKLIRCGFRLPDDIERRLSGSLSDRNPVREEVSVLQETQKRVDAARALGVGGEALADDGTGPWL
jgi:hypothetical protein